MTAASLPFRGVCEENLDKVEWLVEFKPKQLDYLIVLIVGGPLWKLMGDQ